MSNRRRQPKHLVPVVFDQSRIDAVEELVERATVLLPAADGEQPLIEDVADPRRKSETQRRTESEYTGGIASCICVVLVDVCHRTPISGRSTTRPLRGQP